MGKQRIGNYGPMAWLADIEVNKIAYIGSIIMLILGIVMVYQPMFEIITPYTNTIQLTAAELEVVKSIQIGVLVLNLISIFVILVPVLKLFEWKYHWFTIAFAALLVECVGAVVVLNQKAKLVENAMVEFAMTLLSVEVNLTTSGWILMATFVLTLACVVKMIFDIKKNREIYEFG